MRQKKKKVKALEPLRNKLKNKIYYDSIYKFCKQEFNEDMDKEKKKFFQDAQDLDNDRFLITAARGFGKTYLLARLALWSCVVIPQIHNKPYKVSILGGSREQSNKAYEEIVDCINKSEYVKRRVDGEPIKTETRFKDGSIIRALAASSKSVRGGHPHCMIMDECAEIDKDLITAATESLDRYMTEDGDFPKRLVLSSTPHVFDSFFVEHLQNPSKWGFMKYKWKAADSWNKNEEEIKDAKRRLDEDTFRREWMGEAVSDSGTLIDSKDLQKSVIRFSPDIQSEGYITGGLDFGFCFDEETEVLTNNGWKYFDELEYSDKIMTMNPKNKNIEWQYPNSIEIQEDEWEIDVCEIDTKTMSYCTKKNHIFATFSDHGEYKKETYDELPKSSSHRKIPRTGIWKGKKSDKWTDTKIKALSWVLTEGTICDYSNNDCQYGRIDIYQSKSSEHYEYLRDLLKQYSEENDITLNELDRKFVIYDKEIWDLLVDNKLSYNKRIPKEIKELESNKLNILLEEMIKGDGNRSLIWTSSEKMADDIQEIALKSGKHASKKCRNRDKMISQCNEEEYNTRKNYRVNIKESKDAYIGKDKIETKKKISKFGTVQVDNGMIYVRRNGQPYFAHNDHPTAFVIVQKQDGYDYVLEARKWRQKKFEWIKEKILQLYEQYEIDEINADNSHQAVIQRIRDAGAHIKPVSFSKSKQNMISNMLFKFENGRVKIPHKFEDLREELDIYHRERREKDDLVDALMLALKGQRSQPKSSFSKKDKDVPISLGGKR